MLTSVWVGIDVDIGVGVDVGVVGAMFMSPFPFR